MASGSPWVGPVSFTKETARYFFGRDTEASELGYLIIARRAVLLYAQSGAGKTSLLQAKVMPSLEAAAKFRSLRLTRVSGPSRLPNPFVGNLLANLGLPENSTLPEALGSLFTPPPGTALDDDSPSRVLLAIDQFEEIFNTHPELAAARLQFFEQLRATLDRYPDLRLLLSMREDYLADMDSFAPWLPDRLRTRMRMERLTRAQALEAITGPARLAGRPFAKDVSRKLDVAEDLVLNLSQLRTAVAAPGAAPVYGEYVEPVHLQIVCNRLWAKLPEDPPPGQHEITSKDTKDFADVDKALREFYRSSLAAVLSSDAEAPGDAKAPCEANAPAPPKVPALSERTLRKWVGSHLITPARTRDLVYRGERDTEGLPNAAVDVLVAKYIIRADTRPAGTWYELSHDRLVEPIFADNAEWDLQHENPVADAFKANPDQLLDGSALKHARTFVKLHPSELTPEEERFLRDSIRAHLRRRLLFWAAAFASLVLTLLTIWAVRESLLARHREAQAVSMALAAEAEAFLADGDPPQAMAKGLEAVRHVLTPAAHSAVTQALSLKLDTGNSVVSTAAFSPDGHHVITVSEYGSTIMWNAFTGEKLWTTKGETATIVGAAFPPGSCRVVAACVVTVDEKGSVVVLNAENGKRLGAPWPGVGNVPLSQVAFSPDGARFATAGAASATLWNTSGGTSSRLPLHLEGHKGPINRLAFSPDGKLLITASEDNTAIVWNAVDGSRKWVLPSRGDEKSPGHSGSVVGLAFSPDNRFLVTASQDTRAIIWDLASGKQHRVLPGHLSTVAAAAFSPDGSRILTVGTDGAARLWSLKGDPIRELRPAGARNPDNTWDSALYAGAFSPDGRYAVAAGREGSVFVWHTATGQPFVELKGHTNAVTSVSFSPDGGRILTAGNDATARIWNLLSWVSEAKLVQRGQFLGIAFSPDGTRLATSNADKTADVWNLATKRVEFTLTGHQGSVNSVQFSPVGPFLLTASDDTTAQLWDATPSQQSDSRKPPATRRSLATLPHGGKVNRAVFSPDGKWIATASEDKQARLWRVELPARVGKAPEWVTPPQRGAVNVVAFSPQSDRFVTAGDDETAVVWDVASPHASRVVARHKGAISGAVFSPDGTHVATGSLDGTACVWNASPRKAPEKIYCVEGGAPPSGEVGIFGVAFSQDGKWLATADNDRRIRLWDDAKRGAPVSALSGARDVIISLAFSPVGGSLVTASWDGAARVQRGITLQDIALILAAAKRPPSFLDRLFAIDTH